MRYLKILSLAEDNYFHWTCGKMCSRCTRTLILIWGFQQYCCLHKKSIEKEARVMGGTTVTTKLFFIIAMYWWVAVTTCNKQYTVEWCYWLSPLKISSGRSAEKHYQLFFTRSRPETLLLFSHVMHRFSIQSRENLPDSELPDDLPALPIFI